MNFDTKIAVVLRDDLAVQQTNVTAFLVSGIAATTPGIVGSRTAPRSRQCLRTSSTSFGIAFRAERKRVGKIADRLPFHP